MCFPAPQTHRCFNAGIAMRDLALHAPRCLLLTSGTLSPLDSFAFELQTPFPIRLENPHIIGAQQVSVCCFAHCHR